MNKKMTSLWIGTIAIGLIFSGCGSVNPAGNNNTAAKASSPNETFQIAGTSSTEENAYY